MSWFRRLREAPVTVALIVGLYLSANAQTDEGKTAESSFAKCWNISTSVSSEQGVSADDFQSYFVSTDDKLVAVELTSGKVSWTADVGGKPLSELVLAGGKIYYTGRGGQTVVVSAEPEFKILSTAKLENGRGVFNATPAIDGNRLLIRSNKFLYCIGTK